MFKGRKAIWIAWETQQRNRSMAHHLDAALHEIVHPSTRVLRYVRCMRNTLGIIRRERPAVIYFQNPSIVLGLWLVLLTRLKITGRAVLIGDFHNAGLQGPRGITILNRWVAVSCSYVIVSNNNLSRIVQGWGGRPFSFPDPLPDLGVSRSQPIELKAPIRVLFICSWAEDEPVEEVIKAAASLPYPESWEIQITGRPKAARLRAPLPANLALTGFLPEREFHSALLHAHVVMDLTTRDDCMVCGAYEGLAAGKPLVLSANAPTEAWFGKAASYCDNSAASIIKALVDVREHYVEYASAAVERRHVLRQKIGDLAAAFKRCVQTASAGEP